MDSVHNGFENGFVIFIYNNMFCKYNNRIQK